MEIEQIVILVVFCGVVYFIVPVIFVGIKPPCLPFRAFKFFCSIGKKASISQNMEHFQHHFKFQFVDQRYNDWRHYLKMRDSITRFENIALLNQTVKEMNDEIRMREGK